MLHPNGKLASHRTSALARRTVVGLTENTLGGLKDLAETAAAFLGTGWKMSKADLASAMLLLSDMQREHPTERTHNVVTDPQQLRIAAYFMDFVLPSYGAVVLNYFGYGRGFLRDALRINPDRKAVLDHAKLAPADILAWEFGLPELFKPNFYIAHDRRTDAIVLTIRGTLNVHECIVDATTEYVGFLDGYTHKGFAESAAWIEAKYLDAIVGWANSLKCNALYVVGHSLGGAVGALFMMSCMDHIKRATHPDFSVRGCFFASPACASMNLVERFSPHMDSFINESDVVPRLSYGAMLDFRELMVAAAGMLRNKALSRADRIAALHELSVELKATNKHPRIYVPGALYYMYKTSRVHASTSRRAVKQALHGKELVGNELVDELEPHYVVERTDPVLFGDVIIRSNMVYHHLLNKYDNSLRKAHDWLEEWSRPDKFYRDMPKHLVVLHHGLWGNDAHLGQIVRFLSEVAAARGGGAGVGADAGDAQATPIAITDGNALEVAEAIAARAKEPLPESAGDLLFLNASSSAGSLTYDGVDVCGDRLLHSVLGKLAAHGCEPARALSAKSASAENELSADKPEGDDIIDRISLIGYSLGGLIIRYVIGRLDAAGVFDAVRPVNFITLATPHLGTVKPPVSVMTRTYNAVQRSLVGRSGRQMVLADKFHDTNAPLLLLMADTRGVFVRALAKFANRAVFANARNDMTVRYTTSAITASNPFSKYKEIQVDAARYPSIVVPSDSEPKPREPWTSRQIAFVSFISLLSPILLPLWITMLSLGLATLSIKARLREGQIVDDSDWLTGKAQPPALSPARTPSDGADARSGLDSDPKQGQTSPDKPPPAGSPLHELSAQQAAALEPPRQREWMIESLNTLVWRRVNVSLFFTNAHAAIVLRRGAGAGGANVLLYLAREIFRYE